MTTKRHEVRRIAWLACVGAMLPAVLIPATAQAQRGDPEKLREQLQQRAQELQKQKQDARGQGQDTRQQRQDIRQQRQDARQQRQQEIRQQRQEGQQQRRDAVQQFQQQRRDQLQQRRDAVQDLQKQRRDAVQQLQQQRRDQLQQRRDAVQDLRQQRREDRRDVREERRDDRRDVRDLRQDRRDDRRDAREERRDDRRDVRDLRQDRREDRRDVREERRDDRRDVRDLRQDRREERRDVREERRERQFERRRDANENRIRNIEALRQSRREARGQRGLRVLEEADNRRIYRGERGNAFIRHDETARFRRFGDLSVRDGRNGRRISTLRRRNGFEIVTETGPDGRLIRRYRRGPNGRIYTLIDNRRTWRRWAAIGAGAAAVGGLLVAIDAPRWRGPRERYIIDYEDASYDDIYETLEAGPIERLERGYSLDEVLATRNLREYMRRIDLDSINFEFGSWQVDSSQYRSLERIARAIKRLIDKEPDEIVLIEGHTDAVGDETDNLSLSDRRAEEVANILTEEFDIPPENLVTQGYGEQFLKVDTDGPERANRRVTVRRITPLLERRTSELDD